MGEFSINSIKPQVMNLQSKAAILIKNARTHNLKNVSLEIPKDQLVVFTGVSGSGKSSLVFDTIYTEAQRQLIETFSSFARSRLPKLSKPPVDEIRNLATAIIIDQKRMGTTLRSTVGTATEIYTYLRLLFSRLGDEFIGPSFVFGFNHPSGMCPDCKGLGKRIRIDVNRLLDPDKTLREGAIDHPDHKVGGWNWREMMQIGLFDVDKKIRDFSDEEYQKLFYAEAIPVEKKHGAGIYMKNFEGIARKLERLHLNKPTDQLSKERKSAFEKYFVYSDCGSCNGSRINEKARSVRVSGKTIPELVEMELTDFHAFLDGVEGDIAGPMVSKMQQMLAHLIDIGVGYLTLNRSVASLSGGESQRVKMARQLDCDLTGLLYVMDEPSIGLHPRDINRLIALLEQLRDKGNSVFVVEHDRDIIGSADHIIDVGPRAGSGGGQVLFGGKYDELMKTEGITASYLREQTGIPGETRQWSEYLEVNDASLHNLKNISVRIPRGIFTCITGVAGSGKSSLIEVFLQRYRDAVVIDQSPVGRSPRSNPATYIGVFTEIRKEIARFAGVDASLFSFNAQGACPKCKGIGTIAYEMHFLDEVKVVCEDCKGKRYTEEVLEIQYQGKNIADILETTIEELAGFFKSPGIQRKLDVLVDVGLGYLEIGQALSTLSGGEAQRIKLASELHKKGNVYVMDEPTTGLHMADIDRLLKIIKDLVDRNNTVIVIEHNADIIIKSDWVIDMGPEGGKNGGKVLFEGTPINLARCTNSHTGKYLRQFCD